MKQSIHMRVLVLVKGYWEGYWQLGGGGLRVYRVKVR